ncbi:MAG: Dps family protein [Pseudomonadota bacterium]
MKIDIGINEKNRENIAQNLEKFLADSYSLYLKTHFYHWNVTGPMFSTLHKLFEEQYIELAAAVDVIAERIRALGYFAPGTYKAFASKTSIEEDDTIPPATDMIKRLLTAHETVIRTARSIIPIADDAHDETTADLLTQRMQIHEKTAWMLRSFLEQK